MCEGTVPEGNMRVFPPSLEAQLAEAVRWYDERALLERQIAASGHLTGSAQRNQEDRDESDRAGGTLLLGIMEEMIDAWGVGDALRRNERKE